MLDRIKQIDTELLIFLNNLGNKSWDPLWVSITDKFTFLPLFILIIFFLFKKNGTKAQAIVTDIYDTQAWKFRKQQIGAGPDEEVIMLIYCIDAIPAFKNLGESLMPGASMIANLSREYRSKPLFMILHHLIASKLKEKQQKKYFDYMVDTDLNSLATEGIQTATGIVKVLLYGTPLDLPGRDKFFCLRGE